MESSTSGHPWSKPIRVNNFSYALSLIGIFLYGLPGSIVLVPGPFVFVPGSVILVPGQDLGWAVCGDST